MDKATSIEYSDVLEDENGVQYDILGNIQENNKYIKYKKAHLKRRRENI